MVRYIAALVAFFVAGSAQADEWSGRWTAVTTKCSNGSIVKVKEEPGSIRVISEQASPAVPAAERIIPVGADGSGTLMYSTDGLGRVEMRVAAGKGKRQVVLTQQVRDLCQWEIK